MFLDYSDLVRAARTITRAFLGIILFSETQGMQLQLNRSSATLHFAVSKQIAKQRRETTVRKSNGQTLSDKPPLLGGAT